LLKAKNNQGNWQHLSRGLFTAYYATGKM